MRELFKNFLAKQTGIVSILCMIGVCSLFCWSCKDDDWEDISVIIDKIIGNQEIGSIDPKRLIGKWDCSYFAYIRDGKIIDNASVKSNARFEIFTITEDIRCNLSPKDVDYEGSLHSRNWVGYYISVSDGLINFKQCGSTYVNVVPPDEEYDISYAMERAYKFSIKDDLLLIYFNWNEEDDEYFKNCLTITSPKNLLILKKRKK